MVDIYLSAPRLGKYLPLSSLNKQVDFSLKGPVVQSLIKLILDVNIYLNLIADQ